MLAAAEVNTEPIVKQIARYDEDTATENIGEECGCPKCKKAKRFLDKEPIAKQVAFYNNSPSQGRRGKVLFVWNGSSSFL